jgi:hypothetical protein
VLRFNVQELQVAGQRAEQRDSLPDQDRDSGDDQAMHLSGAQESLDGDAAVYVQVRSAGGG